jgi:ankyrin repeat protein
MEGVFMKLPHFLCVIMVSILWTGNTCPAQVYKYVDERGVPCYTDDIYKVPEGQRPNDDTAERSGGTDRSPERGIHGRQSEATNPEHRRVDHLSQQLLSRAELGDVNSIKSLLERGADVHARDKHGETALMKAARLGNYPVVKLLIEFGADVHAIDAKGGTALGYASKFGQEEVADLLKTHGAVH